MLADALWILLIGFSAGQLARSLRLPPLLGMIGAGILLGPEGGQILSVEALESADQLRTVAVMIILMRAGLGLDRAKLAQQGSVTLRLGILPATGEAMVIAMVAIWIFDWDLLTGLLLGCVLSAESPAVIVPGMLRLKSLGWGVVKGIPDVILTGSALSDVLVLLVFSLLLGVLADGSLQSVTLPWGWTFSALQMLPLQVITQVGLGVLIGYGVAWILTSLVVGRPWIQTRVQETLIVTAVALLVVMGAHQWPYYSGYLAVMTMGFMLVSQDPPLARRLRGSFNSLWMVAEIVLFVLMGASVQLSVLGSLVLPGLGILAAGTLIGRMAGWWLSTVGSHWTWKERLFLLPANSAKATVQAAIGAIPLSLGVAGGEIILALAALSILVTAPLGAWAIPVTAPRLLEKGDVDPTKGVVEGRTVFLAAVDTSELSQTVLAKVADLARRSEAHVVVLHVGTGSVSGLRDSVSQQLVDVSHRWIHQEGAIAETIMQVAQAYAVKAIVMGKRAQGAWPRLGSVSQAVLEASPIPVMVVEGSLPG